MVLIGCAAPTTAPTQQPRATAVVPLLRVENRGAEDIVDLAVLFPGPTPTSQAVTVSFGTVVAGGVSPYQPVPSGVYRYSAYTYRLGDRTITQFVTDWIGETPLAGQRFTYAIALNSSKVQGDQVELLQVSVDAP
jgi:hypothetical protein